MNTATIEAPTTPLVRDDELTLHIEDTRCYGAIRHGVLLSNLTWHELTQAEQDAARYNVFHNEYYY